MRPTKSLGQNFVHDPNTVRRIVRAAAVDPADVVLEVGPGLGSLTLGLLPDAAHVHAVEIDPPLAGRLPATVRGARAGRGRPADACTDRDALTLAGAELDPAPTALVANLPYNVAVPVVLHLLAVLPALRHGLVMVQKEVADRLTAAPGSQVYGVPSVKLAWYADGAAGRPGAGRASSGRCPMWSPGWWRSPADRRRPAADRAAVFAVVDAAFAQRRKMLRSALAGWAGGPDAAAAILTRAGVAPTARGEELDVAAFAAIAGGSARR